MPQEYIIGSVSDFPAGKHKVVEINRRQIGVFNINGEFFALPNLCPHQVGPLCQGRVSGTLISNKETDWHIQWAYDGEIVTCPWHGLEYHVPTGQCLAYPEIRLRSYEVWVEESQIKIRL